MIRNLVVVVAAVGVLGCGGGGSGGGGGATASGVAVKGPVSKASVSIHELRGTGALGDLIGSGTSNTLGEFAVRVSGSPGLSLASIRGGNFVDEATGNTMTIPSDAPLVGFVDAQSSPISYAVTPLTTVAFPLMQYFAHDPEATLEDSVENALTSVGNLFGVTDVGLTLPADLTAGAVAAGAAADQGAVVAGISQLAQSLSVETMVLVQALALDAGDGRFDGKSFGTDVPLGAGSLAPTAGTADLAMAITAFLAGPRNASGLTAADTAVDEVLALSSGDFDKPIQVRALANGYGDTQATVDALLKATSLPPSPQVLIETQLLQITSQSTTELGFEIPAGLALGRHDLVLRDQDSGLVARLRGAIEVFDSNATPTVSEVAPPAGPLTGGTFLQLEGTNFGPDTVVEIAGIPAERLAQDFPGWMVVATPPHAAGAVSVTVRNGPQAQTVLSNAFAYRAGDTRANPSLPSATAPIVFGAFRLYADMTNGLTTQALFGRSTFTNFDQGSFSLTDYTSTALTPALATRQRGGATFQSPESLGKSMLLFDSTNGLSDFIRGFTNEENGVSLGATAFGPACFFPEPSNMQPSSIAKSYWVNGLEVSLGQSILRQKTGWLEFDDANQGSASFLTHGRDFGGTRFDLGAEKWNLTYNLDSKGAMTGTRTVGATSQSFLGHFSAEADLGFLVETRANGTLGYYWLVPIEHGVESGGWGGWTGGYLQNEIVDDGLGGDESAFESGTYRGLIAGTAADYSRLAFNRSTRMTESEPEGCFSEYVGAVELDISPSGRLFRDDNLAGYLYPYGGILLALGEFPNECLLNGNVDLPMAIGGAVFRDSRKSYLSMEPAVTQISIEAKFLEVAPTNQQELGTSLFDLTLDPSTPPSVMGVAIPLAGTIPELAAGALTGIHKSTLRDSMGAVTTKRGVPPAWGVTVGYSCIDDKLDLYATEITQAGRFDGASMPRWIASGTPANDGEVTTLRGSDEFLGDVSLYFVAKRGVSVTLPSLGTKAVGLAFEPNSGGLSGVTASRTDLQFLGNGTVTTSAVSKGMNENGTFTSGTRSGLGLNTTPSGQAVRINLPDGANPDREWQTVWSPSGDAFFGIDDTPGVDRVEVILGILPAVSGSFVDDDRNLSILELDPQISRATTQQLLLTPRSGSIMTGELFTSRRDTRGHKVLPAQSFVATAPVDLGGGAARVPIIGQIPVLSFLFNQRDEAIGQQDLTLSITPRIIHSLED